MNKVVLSDTQSGQAMVELALVLPFILLIALSLVDFGMVMHSYVLVTQAAREAARSASFGDDEQTVHATALAAAGSLASERITVTVTPQTPGVRGSRVTVVVKYVYKTFTPGLSQIVPTVTVAGKTAMRVE